MYSVRIISDRFLNTQKEGSELRQLLELDSMEIRHQEIHFDIQTYCTALSDSFFWGLFGPSLSHHPSSNSFFRQYRFTAPEAFDFDLYFKVAGHYLKQDFWRAY